MEKFRELTPSEFFYRNREIAGFSNPARALYQAVRELVENALDATDAHGILPTIRIIVRREEGGGREGVYSIMVEDNGIGIPADHVPRAFGQLLYSSKYVLRQTRGMFGLGAKMAVLYGQITTGKAVEVITSPINSIRTYYFKLRIDIKHNRPVILRKASYPKVNGWHGTIVKLYLEGDWSRARSKIYEYLRRTAIIAPYAEILFEDPDGNIIYFERKTTKMPPPPREVKPHPHGVDIEMVKMMIHASNATTIKEFLVKEFQSIGEVTANKLLNRAGLDPNLNPKELTIEEIERLVRVIKSSKDIKPPKANHLSYLGEEIIKTGLKSILDPEFVEALTRRPSVYEGHAFIVEVGIAYGGSIRPSEKPILLRYANKIPLLYDEGSDVSRKVIDNIDWAHYNVTFPAPLVILVHICSTKVPYKGVGKESIADVPEIEREIELGIRDVARKLKQYIARKRKEMEEAEKAVTIAKYIPDVARSLAKIFEEVQAEKIEKELLKMLNMKLKAYKITSLDEIIVSIE
ncbi:MAG TPA: DNA topoisomerase VI subunit B [Acidilobales archaeon]|nr:DNA topoisomerase VI subunit B [Acidilobales archaeon]